MKIAIIGLGYVGIQLAIVFARQHETIGFDVDENKLDAYRLGSIQREKYLDWSLAVLQN